MKRRIDASFNAVSRENADTGARERGGGDDFYFGSTSVYLLVTVCTYYGSAETPAFETGRRSRARLGVATRRRSSRASGEEKVATSGARDLRRGVGRRGRRRGDS